VWLASDFWKEIQTWTPQSQVIDEDRSSKLRTHTVTSILVMTGKNMTKNMMNNAVLMISVCKVVRGDPLFQA
jgi:methylmalonyl-CoA mutase N-terminal domain/subunit